MASGPRNTNSEAFAAARNRRYEGSQSQKLDTILLEGGTWDEMAEKAGMTKGALKSHAKFRVNSTKSKRFSLKEDGDFAQLIEIPTATTEPAAF